MTAVVSLILAISGCQHSGTPAGWSAPDPANRLRSIMPTSIEIVGPLTQPASFDGDALPDGVQLVLRVIDALGEPARMTGDLVFELYSHRPASADPRGAQLQTWQVALATAADQQTHWNHIAQVYEFPLAVDVARLPIAPRFVITARYTNPWEEHLEDQAVIDLSNLLTELRRASRQRTP